MRIFAFVDAQKTDFTATTLCRVCGVSTSGYYRWVERAAAGPSSGARDDVVVLERIVPCIAARKVVTANRGSPRNSPARAWR